MKQSRHRRASRHPQTANAPRPGFLSRVSSGWNLRPVPSLSNIKRFQGIGQIGRVIDNTEPD